MYQTYVYDGFTRLMHVGDDAIRQNQQNEVVSTWRAGVRCNSAHVNKTTNMRISEIYTA